MTKNLEPRKISIFDGVFDEDGVQVTSGQNELGQETPDPVPMAPPVGYAQHATLADSISRMLKHQLMAQAAAAEGFDTPEEADDFDIEDDPLDPLTPYERHFEPPPAPPPAPPAAASQQPATPPAPPREDAAAAPVPAPAPLAAPAKS